MHLVFLFAALLVDRLVGDPDWLWRRLPHPVVVFGSVIGFADRRFNDDHASAGIRRRNGYLVLAALVGLSLVAGLVLATAFRWLGWAGALFEIAVVAIFLAQKSLAEHVAAVGAGLREGGLPGGRRAVSMIVGRDPEQLDGPGIVRAAIESLAENFSDGIVAPALWYAVGGLPGLFAYKMVNTADSMIGHMSARHRDFGRGAAKLDDLMNWPAARFSAGLIAASALLHGGCRASRQAIGASLRDAGLHRSPNAGWPEAAMAGALGLALGGPRSYGGAFVSAPSLNGRGRRVASLADMDLALKVYLTSCSLLTLIVATAALIATC